MKERWGVILLITIIVGTFIPSIFGEFCTADDTTVFASLSAAKDLNIVDLFFGSSTGGVYFRPLLLSTFYLDNYLWSLSPVMMRLENVLLHLGSCLLIYGILAAIVRSRGPKRRCWPLLGALLFGLNPLVTESVNWVSGRTDLLAGFFVFLSMLALVRFKLGGHWLLLLGVFGAAVCGMLSKEVAIAFAPGALLFLSTQHHPDKSSWRSSGVWLRPLLILGMIVASLVLFSAIRSLAITSNSPKIALTLTFIFNDYGYSCLIAFRLLGFYVTKILFPWPQNFTILEVDPLYELLGMVLALVCLRALFSQKYAAALFLTGVFLLAPTFPLAFNQIAWTPYAERYAYVASGFVLMATVLFLGDRLERKPLWRFAPWLLVPLFAVLAMSTWQRNIIWQTNYALWRDTTEKAPDNAAALNEFGLALLGAGEWDRSLAYFRRAANLPRLYYDEKYDINSAAVHIAVNDFFAAEQTYETVLRKSKKPSPIALQGLIDLYEKELRRNRPRIEKKELHNRLESYRSMSAELESDSTLSAPRGLEFYLFEGDGGLPKTK